MKKTAGILLMLWCIVAGVMTLKAQDTVTHYKSYFGQQSTRWVCFGEYYDIHRQVLISSDRDTVMDGMLYHITYDSLYTGSLDHLVYLSRVYMREDTITGRLWVRTDNGEETLVADMTLDVGDSIFLKYPDSYQVHFYYNRSLYVVDIVFDSNGKNIILRNPEDSFDEMIIIEGIGPSPLHTFMSDELYIDFIHEIQCQMKDGEFVYKTVECPLCLCPYESIESGDECPAPILAPNPTEGTLTVSLDGAEPCEAEVYDATGRCVLREEIAGPRAELDVRRLPAGRYLLRIQCGDRTGTRAFVKN